MNQQQQIEFFLSLIRGTENPRRFADVICEVIELAGFPKRVDTEVSYLALCQFYTEIEEYEKCAMLKKKYNNTLNLVHELS